MNETESARIAAALNAARPDWPIKQLLTLFSDARIARRPRRDVFVAMAWIAAEAETTTPYRVLEAGPWWTAAAAEHARPATEAPEVIPPEHQCAICSKHRTECARNPHGGHEFRSVVEHARTARRADPETAKAIADALKGEINPMTPRDEPRRLATSERIAEQIEHHTNAACDATAHGKHGRAEYEAARADLLAELTTHATTADTDEHEEQADG